MDIRSILQRVAANAITDDEALSLIRASSRRRMPDAAAISGNGSPADARSSFTSDVLSMASTLLHVEPSRIGLKRRIADYGFNSILAAEFIGEFQRRYDIRLSPTIFLEFADLQSLIDHLLTHHGEAIAGRIGGSTAPPAAAVSDSKKPEQSTTKGREVPSFDGQLESLWQRAAEGGTAAPLQVPVTASIPDVPNGSADRAAIVGMAGRMPGSPNLDAFWRNLEAGRSLVGEVSADREKAGTYQRAPVSPGLRSSVRRGGFLEDVDCFDADFFHVSAKEASFMDPQQRLFLETVWHAIEDAGYRPSDLVGRGVGLFVGVATTDYQDLAIESGMATDALMATGMTHAVLANRTSFLFGFRGPSEPINTACSSSLVALHRAVEAIRNGSCEMAIAGGVNLILHSRVSDAFERGGLLSPTGECRSFSEDADGFVRGEGVGAVMLKRLDRAISEGDHIYGIVAGSAVNHNGRSSSLTAPNPDAQVDVLTRAYESSGVDPATIGLLEAYGIGSDLADQVEILALGRAFATLHEARGGHVPGPPTCTISSVKANVGSLETSSGMAALFKVLLAMAHRRIPGIPSLDRPNPNIDLSGTPFHFARSAEPWDACVDPETGTPLPRRAGISSFGFGGSNAHVIVEEHPDTSVNGDSGSHLFVLSAINRERLRESAGRLAEWLRGRESVDLRRVAYTLQCGREAFTSRLATIASTANELTERLESFAGGASDPAIAAAESMEGVDVPVPPQLDSWLRQRSWEPVARHWVAGGAVEWSRLYEGEPVRRIPLPGYPFERRRFWLEPPASRSADAIQSFDGLDLEEHADRRVVFRKIVSIDNPGVADHRVLGAVVLPASILLDYTLAAASAALHREIALADIVFLRPVRVEQAAVRLAVEIQPDRFEIRDTGSNPCVTGRIVAAAEESERGMLPIRDILARCGHADLALLHARLTSAGIEYGDYFRVHTAVWSGSEEALAHWQAAGVAARTWGHHVLPPPAVDAAIQLLAAFDRADSSPRALVGVGALEYHGPLSGHGYAYARSLGADRYDLAITNDAGNVSVMLRDVEVRPLARLVVPAPATDTSVLQIDVSQHQTLVAVLEAYSVRALTAELQRAGFLRHGGDRHDTTQIAAALDVEPQRMRFFDSLVDALELASVIVRDGSLITATGRVADVPQTPPDGLRPQLRLLEASVSGLIPFLRGELTAPEILFPGGSLTLVEDVYGSNVLTHPFTAAAVRLIRSSIPVRDAQVRLIEVGAGTGAMTEAILNALDGSAPRVSYAYTDVSKGFTRYGKERFGSRYPFVEFGVFDVERPVAEQSVAPLSYDLVIAANVLHTTRDVSQTVANLKTLLKPHGRLVLHETTESRLFLSLTFGLLDGWWKFDDDLRRGRTSPLLTSEEWRDVLERGGFGHVAIHDGGTGQALLVAEATEPVALDGSNLDANELRRSIDECVIGCVCEFLGVRPDEVEFDRQFSDFGLDSFVAVRMTAALGRTLGISIKPTVLFNYTTLRQLADYLVRAHGSALTLPRKLQTTAPPKTQAALPPRTQPTDAFRPGASPQDVAIIGIAGRFPGARNVSEFWNLLAEGRCAIRRVPAERWSADEYLDADPRNLRKTYSADGGFLEGIDLFDADFFNITGREAEVTDPQHRLFLEEAWTALEDAGYAHPGASALRCSVFVGASGGDYLTEMLRRGADCSAQAFWGNTASVIAARLSYFLNLNGPSVAVETACSASLVAIHMACQSLWSGESDLAVAGGAQVNIAPTFHVLASNGQMLSKDGRCKAFDRDADGFVPGEAVAAVVLKPLAAALDAGDHVYAVIKASGVNQDGRSNGITAPNGLAQEELLCSTYRRFGIDRSTITLVEAHGTGTKLGDPIEFEALTAAFRAHTERRQYCALGSVKTNIGHTATAAGIASTIKAVLSIQHRQIPPSLHFREANEHIDLESSPFFVNTSLREWRDETPRVAISSFGFGGTNAHLVLEAPPPAAPRSGDTRDWHLIPFSAPTRETLELKLRDFSKWLLDDGARQRIEDVERTLQSGRSHFAVRTAMLVRDMQELLAVLGEPVKSACEGQVVLGRSDGRPPVELLEAAQGYVKGVDPEWTVLRGDSGRLISLPTHPFRRSRYWFTAKPAASSAQPGVEHALPAPLTFLAPGWSPAPIEEAAGSSGFRLVFAPRAEVVNWPSNGNHPQMAIVTAGAEYNQARGLQFVIDPDNPEHYGRVLARLEALRLIPDSIIHLWAHDANLSPDVGIRSMELLIRALLEHRSMGPNHLLYAYANRRSPECEAGAGFGPSLAVLLPRVRVSSIRIAGDVSGPDLLRLVTREASVGQGPSEIEYRDGIRHGRILSELNLPTGSGSPFRLGGTYVITGGAGELGIHLSRHLAERYRPRLVLIGRSELSSDRSARLADIERAGAEVVYYRADVADGAALAVALDQCRKRFGPFAGVVHLAGSMSGKLLTQKTTAEFRETLRAKVQGVAALDEVTAHDPLDFFAVFSSAASLLGDGGQCDYAVANRFLDAFCERRETARARGLRAGVSVSINWPLWREGGMHFSQEIERAYLTSTGLRYIELREGLEAFERILQSGRTQVMPIAGDVARVSRRFPVVAEAKGTSGDQSGPLMDRLREIVSAVAKIDGARISPTDNLGEMGLDSLILAELAERVSAAFDVEILPTAFFEYSTLERFGTYLAKAVNGRTLPVATPPDSPDPAALPEAAIAIVGMSGVFPGSDTLEDFWNHLSSAHDLITEVPGERWNWREYFGDTTDGQQRSSSKWGGFIHGVDAFDAEFFDIEPRRAALLDPQHRLFLEQCWLAIEEAGYDVSQMAGSRTGVFAGVQFTDYSDLLTARGCSTPEAASENRGSMMASRVCRLLDLRGPSETINTACSASLVAIDRAVNAMQAGACDAALVGGVSLMISPQTVVAASQLGVLSPDGRCRTFDAGANGFVKGEGVGVLFLKRLSDAQSDGDHIHAVVRGSAVNHGGSATSLTAPNAEAQSALIVKACQASGVDPDSITFIETHGTGTRLGDPVEVQGILKAFPGKTIRCGLGSVKTNIGHLEPAAGVAGMIKVILAMRHGVMPGTPNLTSVNPLIRLDGTPFFPVQQTQPWNRVERAGTVIPRRAGVSSFGFGGTNAHVVLEESPQVDSPASEGDGPWLFVWSDKSLERLRADVQQFLDGLEHAIQSTSLPAIAYTLRSGRQAMEARLAVVASTSDGLRSHLAAFLAGRGAAGLHLGTAGPGTPMPVNPRDLDAVGAAWAQGARVDWSELNNGNRRRVSLPPRVFSRRRFWFDDSAGAPPEEVGVGFPESGIALLRLQSSSFSSDAVNALRDALGALRGRDDLKVVVLTGTGRVFCRCDADMREPIAAVLRSEVPVIAAVQGDASGSGLTLALSADMIVLAEEASCAAPIVPDSVATAILRERLGEALAAELLMVGAPYAGSVLKARGAAMTFVSADRVLEEALTLARSLKGKLRPSLKLLKADLSGRFLSTLASGEHARVAPAPSDITAPRPSRTPSADVEAALAQILRRTVHLQEIDMDAPFAEMGIDSISGVEIIHAVNRQFSLALEAVVLYDYPSPRLFAAFVESALPTPRTVTQPEAVAPESSHGWR